MTCTESDTEPYIVKGGLSDPSGKAHDAHKTLGVTDMGELTGRDLHLVRKALAIAVLAIERQPGRFQSTSDQADMKVLLDRLIKSNEELAQYARAAQIAVTGEPPAPH